ncbi:MAG: cytidylate kinase [Bacteroides sp. SM23_62]|nr:MAG: cytidylate kinase [Bacteroides sp. SM23_62]
MKKSKQDLVIAIDGHSSGGKSTYAKMIAKELGITYVDSGAMYRAVTLYAMENNLIRDNIIDGQELVRQLDQISIEIIFNPEEDRYETWLNGRNIEKEIRTVAVSNYVSPVSKIREVREAMVDLQRKMSRDKGVVMDGRDIGTVVFPDADIKIYLTAEPDIRAQRRFDELKQKGMEAGYDEILENIMDRDHQDSTRDISPLKKADDAIELDNSSMTPEEQMVWFMNKLEEKFG